MNPRDNDTELARRIRAAARGRDATERDGLRERFATRLGESAARSDAVPVEIDGRKLAARRGATVLAAAMKNGIRLMHVCGARKLCATCRVKITAGAQYLSPMSPQERLSLRAHLSVSPRTRLGCQARIQGPIEAETVFPLCGDLPESAEDSRRGEAAMTATALRAWPLRLRMLSFAITIAVGGLEALLVALPIAIVLWLCGAATTRAVGIAIVIALGWGLSIALYSHMSPVGLPRRIFNGTGT